MSNVQLQCLLGLQTDKFVMIAADQTNAHSVIVMKSDENKMHELSPSLVMGVNGDGGDTAQFAHFVGKNLQLYRMRNGYQLSTAAAIHYTRRNLSEALRSETPYMVNILMGGWDPETGGQLYYMDFLSACLRVPYAAHGIGGLLSIGVLDQYHSADLNLANSYRLLKLCVEEVQRRLFVALPNFKVVMIDARGVHQLPTISSQECLNCAQKKPLI